MIMQEKKPEKLNYLKICRKYGKFKINIVDFDGDKPFKIWGTIFFETSMELFKRLTDKLHENIPLDNGYVHFKDIYQDEIEVLEWHWSKGGFDTICDWKI